MDELTRMLEETIEACDEMAEPERAQETEICTSSSEEETKLFWEVTADQQRTA